MLGCTCHEGKPLVDALVEGLALMCSKSNVKDMECRVRTAGWGYFSRMWLISIAECRIEFLRSLKFSPKLKDHSALCLFVCVCV